jgi:hypothetical protein
MKIGSEPVPEPQKTQMDRIKVFFMGPRSREGVKKASNRNDPEQDFVTFRTRPAGFSASRHGEGLDSIA